LALQYLPTAIIPDQAHGVNVASPKQEPTPFSSSAFEEQVFPDAAATSQFLTWLQQFSLGRKRLLDTLLAATYRQAGVHSLLTTNAADFAVFGTFTCITPKSTTTP
jgi:hypothetical protein